MLLEKKFKGKRRRRENKRRYCCSEH